MITLGTLKTEFSSILANALLSSRIADWVHWVATDIISSHDYWWNKKLGSLTTVASQSDYFLSPRVNGKQVLWMGDSSNQRKEITEVDLQTIYRFDSTPTDTGNVEHWAYVEQAEIQAATTSAATLSVVSSSAVDNSTTLIARGRVSSVDRYEEISLSGTTSVAGTLSFDADGIESICLASACVGVVTITSGATTVATIPPGNLRVQCPRIKLWRLPSSALTLPYIYYQNIRKPIKDSDIIDLPDIAFKTLRRGMSVIGNENNGDIDFMQLNDSIYEQYKQDLYNNSTRELNKVYKKDFRRGRGGDVPFTLPYPPTVYTIT